MKDLVIEGIKALQTISPSDLEAYGDLLLPSIGAGLSAFFMYMQKLFKVNRGAFMLIWVLIGCFAISCILYVKQVITGNPVLATSIAGLSAVIAHNFLYKPLMKKLVPWFKLKLSNARLLKAQKNTPEEEIPGRISGDFSL